jgi:hypothetical protein
MGVLYPHCVGLDVHKDTVVGLRASHGAGTVKREARLTVAAAGTICASVDASRGEPRQAISTQCVFTSAQCHWSAGVGPIFCVFCAAA